MSTKLVEFKACPLNLWISLQHVHEISGIHSLSTKFVDITAVCSRKEKEKSVFKKFVNFSAEGTVFLDVISYKKET